MSSDLAVRLPRTYDVARMQRDLDAVRSIPRAPQPGPYHNGEWTGIALHSQGGRQSAHPGYAGLEAYHPTEALSHTPYLKEILDGLLCPKKVVRLLTLPAGVEIEEHNDAWANFQCGALRLHVPIVTHPDIVFYIGGERVTWREGELWYGDFASPHWLRNESSITRVHMVIDVEINDFVLGLFPPDFVARRRAEGDGISTLVDTLPTSPEALSRYVCDFRMPSEAMPLFGGGKKLTELTAGARGAMRVIDGRLVAVLDDKPAFALERVRGDTFGILGLSAGCTVEFTMGTKAASTAVTGLDLVLKGLPGDLYAAQLGFQQGPMLTNQRIALPLALT